MELTRLYPKQKWVPVNTEYNRIIKDSTCGVLLYSKTEKPYNPVKIESSDLIEGGYVRALFDFVDFYYQHEEKEVVPEPTPQPDPSDKPPVLLWESTDNKSLNRTITLDNHKISDFAYIYILAGVGMEHGMYTDTLSIPTVLWKSLPEGETELNPKIGYRFGIGDGSDKNRNGYAIFYRRSDTEIEIRHIIDGRSVITNKIIGLYSHADIPILEASLTQAGVVKLSNKFDGVSESIAVTEKALSSGLASVNEKTLPYYQGNDTHEIEYPIGHQLTAHFTGNVILKMNQNFTLRLLADSATEIRYADNTYSGHQRPDGGLLNGTWKFLYYTTTSGKVPVGVYMRIA